MWLSGDRTVSEPICGAQFRKVDATSLAPPFTFGGAKSRVQLFRQCSGVKGSGVAQCCAGHQPKGFRCANRCATEMVVKSVIEGIHFYKTEKSEDDRDPEKIHEAGKRR